MIVKIVYSNNNIELYYDIFNIEKHDFKITLKQQKRFTYRIFNLDVDKIKSIEILKVK